MYDYHAFGMEMPGRTFSGNGIGGADYRYDFNGKEDDKQSGWFTQDYGFRTYDYRLGRFLSQDPLFGQYSELTPYQFASNRPIDGVDLDGLEHLKSDEARIEITSGGVMLKIQNFTWPSQNGWEDAVNNPKAWTFDENREGQQDVGVSRKIGDFSVITPQQQNLETETSKTQTQEKYFPNPASMRKGTYKSKKRHLANTPPPGSSGVGGANSKTSKGVNYGLALIDLYQWIKKDVGSVMWAYDMGQVDWDIISLKISIMEVNKALQLNMIPIQYQNQESISAITNVVLQGVNNTNDPKIYQIGMSIYNTFNPHNTPKSNGTHGEVRNLGSVPNSK